MRKKIIFIAVFLITLLFLLQGCAKKTNPDEIVENKTVITDDSNKSPSDSPVANESIKAEETRSNPASNTSPASKTKSPEVNPPAQKGVDLPPVPEDMAFVVGQKISFFQLADLDGKKHSRETFSHNKLIVLNFWTTY